MYKPSLLFVDYYELTSGRVNLDFNKIEYKLHDLEVTDSEIAIGKMVLAGAKMI